MLLSDDLSSVEKQLLNEWKRFKSVSLNNCDPNFKPNMISKLFQVKLPPPEPKSVNKLDNSSEIDIENNFNNQDGQIEDQPPVTRNKRNSNISVDLNSTNDEPHPAEPKSNPKKTKTPRYILINAKYFRY